MGVLRIVPDLRDSGRSAGARGVPRDARGPAWWLALLVCKPLLLLGRRADWRGTERLPGSGGVVLAANRRLNTAYLLKESFGQLWDYEREGWARKFFDNWRASLKWQRLSFDALRVFEKNDDLFQLRFA